MQNNFYKKYIFIPDLMLVSVWAIFAARYSLDASICVIAIILLRIALCFQMRDHSKWTLFSACSFLFAYIYIPGNSCFEYVTQEMGYYLMYIFERQEALSIYTDTHYSYPSVWIFVLQIFWIAWNMIMPVIVGLVQLRKFHKDKFRKTLMLCLALSVVEIGTYCAFYYNSILISIVIIGFALAPYLLWIYRHSTSTFERISSDKDFTTYVSIIAIVLSSILIGLREVYILRPIALMTFPLFIYYVVVSSEKKTPQLYSCALVISGFAFWLSLGGSLGIRIGLMTISASFIVYVGIKMMKDLHRKLVPLLFVIAIPCLIYPMICGYNPYTVLHAENTRPFLKSINTRNGLFVIEKNGKYGFRDRYDEIIAPRYEKIEVMDANGRVVSLGICDTTFNSAGFSCHHYGVYDLKKHKFIINPDSVDVDYVYRVDDNTYLFYKAYNRGYEDIIAQLILPGYYYADYYDDPHLEPYFEDEDNPESYFLGLGYQIGEDYDGRDISDLRFPNKHAHNIFAKFLAIRPDKESPMNDLNRARAFKRFVDDSSYYKGDTELALKHIADAIIPLNTEVNGEPTTYQLYLNHISNIRMALVYDELIAQSFWVTKTEYKAYHNLCKALFNGYFSNSPWKGYYEEPYQNVLVKYQEWYDKRRKDVVLETSLWNGHTIQVENQKSLKDIEEVNNLLAPLAPTTDDPYRFNKTWLEIHTVLNDWYEARCLVADEMEGKRKEQYMILTKEILARHYDDISFIISGKSL